MSKGKARERLRRLNKIPDTYQKGEPMRRYSVGNLMGIQTKRKRERDKRHIPRESYEINMKNDLNPQIQNLQAGNNVRLLRYLCGSVTKREPERQRALARKKRITEEYPT